MKTPCNNISVVSATNEAATSILGDVDFALLEPAHLADVVGSTVLQECLKHDIQIPTGKYNLRILLILTTDSE